MPKCRALSKRGASFIERRENPGVLNFGLAPLERRGERLRVSERLAAAGGPQVLALCAPLGSGKSTAIRHFAFRTGTAIWTVPGAVLEGRGEPLEVPAGDDLLIIDDFDAAPAAWIDAFVENVISGRDRRRYILVGRSAHRMGADRLLASDVASIIESALLNFTAQEIEALGARYGTAWSPADVDRLLYETDGWPPAVHWIVRDAARGRMGLGEAFDAWLGDRGHYFLDFVSNMYRADAHEFAAFLDELRDRSKLTLERLRRFEILGFPVLRSRGSLRPVRILATLATLGEAERTEVPAMELQLTIKLFGRARFDLGGKPLTFVRHRDQALLCFVAVAPDGCCTRASLLEAFWPGQARDTATQGLRTTLSRIRSAIRAIVGPDAIERYFRSDDDVSLDFDRVTVDAQRFLEHVRLATIEDARANGAQAKIHYNAAEELYTGRLLASEYPDACFEPIADEFEVQSREVLKRMLELFNAEGDVDRARDCAVKLLKSAPRAIRRENAYALFARDVVQTA